MLEKLRYKYANQTLFEVAGYLINRNFSPRKDLYPIWSEIHEVLDIEQAEYIEAVLKEVDFTTLNVDEFLNSIDESKYSTTLIPSGLHYYDGYYTVTDWNNHLPVSKFIKHILISNKHWEILEVDGIYRDSESAKKSFR